MANSGSTERVWGKDPLSEHIVTSAHNAQVSFTRRAKQFDLARDVDAVLQLATGHATELSDTEAWFAPLLLQGSHATYAGSIQLALAGQLPQSFMLQRGALEYAIYGFYLASDEARQTAWLSRHKSQEHRKAVLDEFKAGRLLEAVSESDAKIGAKARKLYNHTIDHGAHPNSRGLLQVLDEGREGKLRRIDAKYFVQEYPLFENCLKTAAEVGIVSMRVFGLLWPDEFEGWGAFSELDRLEDICCGAEEA